MGMDEQTRNHAGLFRREAARLVSLLTRILGTENLELAEDVVQDTLFQAMETWKVSGWPDNPGGWLFRTAKNKAIDALRRQRRFVSPARDEVSSGPDENGIPGSALETGPEGGSPAWDEGSLEDDLLGMMFACCHPGLPAESQVALILKTLCGFGTAEIAQAFLAEEDTISKRLYRAKEFFRRERIRPGIPPDPELPGRLEPVLTALYLLFNEGYRTTQDTLPIRADLMGEAMLLGKLLAENRFTGEPRVFALMALMCFHAARNEGRLAPDGAMVPLASQDRGLWDRRLVAAGEAYMERAASGDTVSAYHLEAAIAWEHCSAPAFAATAWERILGYYGRLCALGPNPMAELNRLAALLEARGPAEARAGLAALESRFALDEHVLYHALRGEIRARSGDAAGARECYAAAEARSRSGPERAALRKKSADLQDGLSKSEGPRSS
jgi:RNA polymerase sigma factor (sigma-70 family)